MYHWFTIWKICGNWLNGNLVVHIKIVKYLSFSKIDQIAIWWTTNLMNCHSADYIHMETQTKPELFRMHLRLKCCHTRFTSKLLSTSKFSITQSWECEIENKETQETSHNKVLFSMLSSETLTISWKSVVLCTKVFLCQNRSLNWHNERFAVPS